jgi:hypothetical protein
LPGREISLGECPSRRRFATEVEDRERRSWSAISHICRARRLAQDRGERTAAGVAGHRDAIGVDSERRGVGEDPLHSRLGIADGGWKFVLGREAVADRNDRGVAARGEDATEGVMSLEASGDKPAAMEIDDGRERPVRREPRQ